MSDTTLKMLDYYFPETKDIKGFHEGVAMIVARQHEILDNKQYELSSALINRGDYNQYSKMIFPVVYRLCKELSKLKNINFKFAPGPAWQDKERWIICTSQMVGRIAELNQVPDFYMCHLDYETDWIVKLCDKIVSAIDKDAGHNPGRDIYFHSFDLWPACRQSPEEDAFIIAIRYAKDKI